MMTLSEDFKKIPEVVRKEMAQRLIADKQLDQFFKTAKDFAMETEEKTNEVTMMIICHLKRRGSADDKPEWIETALVVPDLPDDKAGTMQKIGAKVYADNPDYMLVCAVQISEGWMVQHDAKNYPDGKMPNPEDLPAPSKDERRLEVLITDALTIDKRQVSSIIPIIRKSSGSFGMWGAEVYRGHEDNIDNATRENYILLNLFRGMASATVKELEDA